MKIAPLTVPLSALMIVLLLALPGCGGDEPEPGPPEEIPTAQGGLLDRGITRTLAEARAAVVEDLLYDLDFVLDKGADATEGSCTIAFTLKSVPENLAVDFAGEALVSLEVNGEAVAEPRIVENHIVIPGDRLTEGANSVAAAFRAKVGRGGTPLTRFVDESDGTEYLYTLLVPADAHRLFPCFDQPDLKGRLALTLDVPAQWTAVSNAPVEAVEERSAEEKDGRKKIVFQRTKLLSTYVMAFATGDYVKVDDTSEDAKKFPMSFYMRRSKRDKVEAEELFTLNRRALKWCVRHFDTPYPFEKYEFVLVPGFPYGGMEHAGAIFYRETSLVFDQEPVQRQIFGRQILIYHEMVHQWFGDLVTMKWFDDLWLKEGFATYFSYRIVGDTRPSLAWFRFHQLVKMRSYEVDSTAGTVPVYQELDNLYDAKSAYGAIVYNKAPALLRQLDFQVGNRVIRDAVKLCLARYAYGNADWREIFACVEEVSGEDMSDWLQAWLLTADMPVVKTQWDVTEDGNITNLVLEQEPLHGTDTVWPMRSQAMLWYAAPVIKGQFNSLTMPADFENGSAAITRAEDHPAPFFVFSNAGDRAYGKFEFDKKSLHNLPACIPNIRSPILRVYLTSALWDTVRDARMDPAEFAEMSLQVLETERDSITFEIDLRRIVRTLDYYLGAEKRKVLLPQLEALLLAKIEDGETTKDMRLSAYRALVRVARSPESLAWLRKVLDGEVVLKDISLSPRDRWQIVGRMLAAGVEGAGELFETERGKGGVDVERYAFVARASTGDAAVKEEYFEAFMNESKWPEQWLEESLGGFNTLSQSGLTLPYLRRALDSVEWVKDHRKIFFMPRWIASFINGHNSKEALEIVQGFLDEREDLPRDIRLKILQSVDDLERAVRTREAYGR